MVWLVISGAAFLLNRIGGFWLWRARLSGSYLADRISYALFLTIGTLISISLDLQLFHEHFHSISVWTESLLISMPAIVIGEFLYLRKETFIIETIAVLRSRNTKI